MFYLGVDVSQTKLTCTLLLDPKLDKHKSKVVANSLDGVYVLVLWCGKQGASADHVHAVLDGRSPYHHLPATTLTDCGVTVSIVDFADVQEFGLSRAKQGKHAKPGTPDALELAHYALAAQPATWQPPPAHVRELDALTAQRDALMKDRLCSQNRQKVAEANGAPVLVEKSIIKALTFYDAEIARLERAIEDHISHHPDPPQHAYYSDHADGS